METTIYQQNEKGCGYSCIKMALVHYSKDPSYKYLKEPTSNNAPSIKDLIKYASKYGLELEAYQLNNKEDLQFLKEMPIFLLLNEKGFSHMVYVYKKRGKYFYLSDPAKGSYRATYKELEDKFDGYYLTTKNNLIIKGMFNNPIKEKSGRFSSILLETLSFLLIFSGFFFIYENGNFIAPLILFTLSILFKLIEKIDLIRKLRNFDEDYKKQLCKIEVRKRRELFEFYNKFKIAYFSGPISTIASFIEVFLLSILICLNDGAFSFGLLICLILSTVCIFIGKTSKEKRIRKLNENETMFLNSLGSDDALNSLFDDSYELAIRSSIKETIFFFVDLVVCLLICLFSQTILLNYMLFSLMSIYYIQEKYEFLLNKLLNKSQYSKDEAYFIGHFLNK